MSYSQRDTSASLGSPIECYEFVAPHKTWRVTSYHDPITVAGKLFSPLPITRTAVETSSVVDSSTTMDFNIPLNHEIAKQFCFTTSPRKLEVTVYRTHEGEDYSTEYKIEYRGDLYSPETKDKWAVLKMASKLQTKLSGNLSAVYYQRSCNHKLFDSRCKVVRADYTRTATVTKVQNQIITTDSAPFSNGELVGGEMTNTRTGEVQSIVTNEGLKIRVGFVFFDIQVDDVLELTQGCDHLRLGHCKNRFNNVKNYGGFDFVPEKNPFEQLNYDTTTSTTKTVREQRDAKLRLPNVGGGTTVGF